MQTVLSKTGIEVCYPCTVHLLVNGTNFEYEYKSDHVGRDLLQFICKIQNIEDTRPWGLKFVDTTSMDEQRYWLDLDKLIRTQVRNLSPIRFYFRAKVYPPEPYKIYDQSVRLSIFQQLRLDLLGGRLFCEVNDAAMLAALILQYVHDKYNKSFVWMYSMYMKSNILRRERCTRQFYAATQKRALEIYQKLLPGVNKLELEDLFLRLASQLISYGVEPFLVRNTCKQEFRLCMNYTGLWTYEKGKEVVRLYWNQIYKITHEDKVLLLHLSLGGVMVFECTSSSECSYIWSIAVDHLVQFTSPKFVTTGVGVDALSEVTSFFGSCITEYKCSRFENEAADEQLSISSSIMRLFDLNCWKSQLSILYVILIIYVMSTHTTVFDELPYVCDIKNSIKTFMWDFIFNKLLTY